MMKNKISWDKQEEEVLIRLFNSKKSIPSIAEHLQRTSKSVESKIWDFKLKRILSK